MGRLIEEQAVIECLTNTAKYYELEDADEWTKGIHYGLLHGLDNILDNVPTVEAIPKADYEARLKADMLAMLEDLDLLIYKFDSSGCGFAGNIKKIDAHGLVQQKIRELEKKINEKTKSSDEP